MITDNLSELVAAALDELRARGVVSADAPPTVTVERPRRREHGDWATNVALAVARTSGRSPREIAEAIAERLGRSSLIDRVEVAGPGFLNFHLAQAFFH